jgi:hypothetical protein
MLVAGDLHSLDTFDIRRLSSIGSPRYLSQALAVTKKRLDGRPITFILRPLARRLLRVLVRSASNRSEASAPRRPCSVAHVLRCAPLDRLTLCYRSSKGRS